MSFRKPFRAAPLRRSDGTVIPISQRPARRRNWGAIVVLALAVALVAAGLAMRYGDLLTPRQDTAELRIPDAGPQDTLSGLFVRCGGSLRVTCVVDGDTFWFSGEKYRIADINTPEIASPQCDNELVLGERATARLIELLNAGPFSLQQGAENTDRYGRKLRTVWRGGVSLGDMMVEEGLAEHWQGFRGSWC